MVIERHSDGDENGDDGISGGRNDERTRQFSNRPMGRADRILQGRRRFEMLDAGCGLEAEVNIAVSKYRGRSE
ncbi:hypothetical protein EVAR_4277_1 [Eumeta japonica]|uniref:Uncharacterized protein n=1 Tax=Eumeta variegata TaxID=151549 RepID=A0A4C1VBY3_EUMVA|nr:hypothetical protein EVAR_4277_1 [Eumeta japonica]